MEAGGGGLSPKRRQLDPGAFEGDTGRTLVVYQLHAEPKIRIPKKLQLLVQKKAAPDIIRHLRKVV